MKNYLLLLIIIGSSSSIWGQDILSNRADVQRVTNKSVANSEITSILKKANTFSIKEVDSATIYFHKAMALAHTMKSNKQVAEVLLSKGLYYHNHYHYVEAIKHFEEVSLLLVELKDYSKLALVNIYIGSAYEYSYSEDKAFKSYLRALKNYRDIKDEIGIAKVYSRIGNVYYQKKNYTISVDYFNKALELYKKNQDKSGVAYSYSSIANSITDSGDYEKGLEFYSKSNEMFFTLKDDYGVAVNYNNIGDTYINLKQYDKALEYFQKSLTISKKIDNKDMLAVIYLNVANIKYKQNNFQEAISYANKSQKISIAIDDLAYQAENLSTLSKAYEKIKNYQKALKYKNQYIQAKEKMLSDNNDGKVLLFQQLVDHEKKLATINDLTIKNENTELKLQSKKRLSYFFIFIFSISIGFIAFLIVQQNSKKKAYKLLAAKSEQISVMNDEIQVQRDHLKDLNSAKDKFFKILAHDLKNPLSAIEGLTELMIEDDASLDETEKMLFLKSINESAHKASSILNELFIWAISQETILKTKSIVLFSLISDEIKLLEIQALHKKVSVIINVDTNISVDADENMLATVLRNLISNAIKYSNSHGEIAVTTKEENGFVEVTIKDDGIGMSQSEIKNIFTADFNKSKMGTANEEGHGLGLILCKEFIEKQGGKIWVQSIVDKGSEFKFTLPLSVQNEKQLV
ncbi:Signal transduction histidine kinase [Flavobacterium gillisiae]|uniref:histidine kinase n=1 Tax=Flavobacterium gillisiae TaxID=150146 RepID=A0A1H3YR51_9FLAO|nr:tetratricopeptide repeat protein [Flavobacterium gillisiae]SEA14039.1 Signal transduction histidine kinase [Flavobacterium gillisiae]